MDVPDSLRSALQEKFQGDLVAITHALGKAVAVVTLNGDAIGSAVIGLLVGAEVREGVAWIGISTFQGRSAVVTTFYRSVGGDWVESVTGKSSITGAYGKLYVL